MNRQDEFANPTKMNDFFALQIKQWPEVASRYDALTDCRQRLVDVPLSSGETAVVKLLYNPARAVSTGAKTDAVSVAKRPCFLCKENRPVQQLVDDTLLKMGFVFLVNPFPILKPHFTIASVSHIPQDDYPLAAMQQSARQYPSLLYFYNGAGAGASAPDHLHFQAVAKEQVSLIREVEEHHTDGMDTLIWSGEAGIRHPAGFWSIKGSQLQLPLLIDKAMTNLFLWQDNSGDLRAMLFPRRRHRAIGYPVPMVSPGALDVAGLMVTVKEDEFLRLDGTAVADIYAQTCYSPSDIPPGQ